MKTRQVDVLRDFYGSLGIEFVEEKHGKGPVHFAGRVGDLVFEIYPLPSDDTPVDSSTRLGFVVAELTDVIEALKGIGANIATEPHETQWGLRAVVRDPDGRWVELYQR